MDQKSRKYSLPVRLLIPIKILLMAAGAYIFLWLMGTALSWAVLLGELPQAMGSSFSRVIVWLVQVSALMAVVWWSVEYFYWRPLRNISSAMRAASEGEFSVRAQPQRDDELGELATCFNTALARITQLAANKAALQHHRAATQASQRYERTNQRLQQAVQDLSLLYEIGQKINTVVELNQLYKHLTVILDRYLHISEFALMTYDSQTEELRVAAANGFPDSARVLGTVFHKGEGITGMTAQAGRTMYIRDTSREPRFLHYKGKTSNVPSSFLSVPLVYKKELLGVINFGRRGVNSFSTTDVKMLSLVSNQVALAIANARLYTQMRELSVKDELTGVYNRRHLQQTLQMEWKRAVRFGHDLSVIMIDVDFFKQFNDTHGHPMGDRVLRRIGQILLRNLREVDTVARFGGEEFVLLLPDTDRHGAVAVAEKIRQLVAAESFRDDQGRAVPGVTISAGIAAFPGDVSDMDDLIDHADIALYRAKAVGRNQVMAYQPLSDESGETSADDESSLPSLRKKDRLPTLQ